MEVIGDRYHLDAELGTGGTATVWLARDLVLDRACAVKLLLPTSGSGAEARAERLKGEALTLQALDHPHVVRILDQGEHEGRVFVVMEYVEGGSLADLLQRDGPLLPTRAVRYLLQVLDALQAAHGEGIVHRDVKPGNILLRSDDEVALCDFGIARFERVDGGTRTGVALGSVGFMAPEQRVDARKVGPPADVYAAACTLFNLLTDDTPVDLYLAPDHSPRWEAVPAPLRSILRRATRTDPSERYLSADEMGEALRSVQSALEGIQPARRRAYETPVGAYVQTQVPGGPALSLDAQHRDRGVQVEDWAWAKQSGRPAGRMALWVGVALVLGITAMGLSSGPLLEDFAPEPPEAVAAPPEPQPPPRLVGRWRGNVGGDRPMTMVLAGPGAVSGEISISLGKNGMRARVTGSWDAATGELVLQDPDGATWRAHPGEVPGLLVGTMQRVPEGPVLPFALVWVGAEE